MLPVRLADLRTRFRCRCSEDGKWTRASRGLQLGGERRVGFRCSSPASHGVRRRHFDAVSLKLVYPPGFCGLLSLSLREDELRDECRAGDQRVSERHLGADAHSVRLPGNRGGAPTLPSGVSRTAVNTSSLTQVLSRCSG